MPQMMPLPWLFLSFMVFFCFWSTFLIVKFSPYGVILESNVSSAGGGYYPW